MKNFINFMLGSTDQTEDFKKLQSLLENTGIEAKITTNTSSSGDYKASFLSIAYDDDVVRVKKKRNAGRPFKGHVGRYTCGQIREMQRTMSNREIAELLELSERSLYRRLKEYASSADEEEFL